MSTETAAALHTLRATSPAEVWTDALPVGNGHRGAMSAGPIGGERLWLNDGTAWSGRPGADLLAGAADRGDAAGAAATAAIRAAIAAGDIARAEALIQRQQTPWVQAFLPLAHVEIDVETEDGAALGAAGPADGDGGLDYRRALDLDTGVAHHEYTSAGIRVRHETHADRVTGAIVHRVKADAPVRLRVRIGSLLRAAAADPAAAGDELVSRRHLPVDVAPGHESPPEPIVYDAAAGRIGAVVVTAASAARIVDGGLRTTAATAHELRIGTATSPSLPGEADDGTDAAARARTIARRPSDPAAHVRAHRAQYRRASLELPSAPGAAALAGHERVARAAAGAPDPGLHALLFHYGRYLLMAASQPGGVPLNLQGIWNAELPGPWSSAYTTNINLQMAYWPAEVANLAECHEPLLRFTARVAATSGPELARGLHGAAGWALHHNADVWGHAAPVGAGHGDPAWAFWPWGGVWLALHLWDHYTYGGDREALREQAWPVLEGAARFALDWVQDDGRSAWTSPSTSPENHYLDEAGAERAVAVTATMDVALVRELAAVSRAAADALELDPEWVPRLAAVAARLPDPRVGPDGGILEWDRPRTDAEPEHRHLSHLVGLFPFAQITREGTPALARAAAVSILGRGPESTGWALAWRAAMWARLGDGARVAQTLALAQRPASSGGGAHRGGLYGNLFSAHPPFQLDGNLGLVAAIAESLVQGDGARVLLLPALPPDWPKGAIRGIRVRGGVTVDLEWSGGAVDTVRLVATSATTMEVSGPGIGARRCALQPGTTTVLTGKDGQ